MTKKDQLSKDSRVTRLPVHAPVPEEKKGKRKQERRRIEELPDGPVKSALIAQLKGKCRQDRFNADFKAKAKGQCCDKLATYTANKCNVPPSQFTPLKPGLVEKPTSSRHREKFGESSKKAESDGQISQNQTEMVSFPVDSNIFSSPVDVPTTAKTTSEKFPSTVTPTSSNDQPKGVNQIAEEKVIGVPIGDSKRKKKVPTTELVGQVALPSAPIIIGDFSKKVQTHGQTSLLAQQSRTKSVPVPVVGGIFSEGVAVSTTASFNSKRHREKFGESSKKAESDGQISQNRTEMVSFPVDSNIFSSPVDVPTTAKTTSEKFPSTVTPTSSNDQPKGVNQIAEEKVIVVPIGDSKRKKKVPTTELVGQVALPSAPIIIGDLSKKVQTHGQTSLLAQQSRTKSVPVPVVGGIFSEGVAVSTTASFNSKRAPEKFPSTLTPTPSNDRSKRGNQNAEGKVIVPEVASNKVEESKKLAEEASCVVAGTSGHAGVEPGAGAERTSLPPAHRKVIFTIHGKRK